MFFLLILEAWDGIDDVFNFIWRRKWNSIFINLLVLLVIILVILIVLLLVEILIEILSILRDPVEEELLVLSINVVGVALL